MDDLVIPAKDEKEGLEKLREVLEVASNKEELPNYISMRVNKDMAPFYSKKQKTENYILSIICRRKTTPAEEKYSSYELEVLAVVNALKKFRTYLLGNHFKIITDCSAFQKTMDKKDLVTRVARWRLLLEEYDYEIVHRSGQRMQHVNALSRENPKSADPHRRTPRERSSGGEIHRTLIPVLTKLSIDDPTKWYKLVVRLHRSLNRTSNRRTKGSTFELLTGVSMRNREDLYLRNLLMEEMVEELQEQRNQLRQDAKRNIQKIQAENIY
ncbi:retrovirus-related Pol polyprotein from transposon 17.6 [Trichonephila clavipes]|nr:retrovirus-related Pol polyprotein from transposon 17.6 [Trichonephila clavipes]